MRIKLDEGAYMPERAHATDAGLDLKAMETKKIPPRGFAVFDTGVHVELPRYCCGILVSKSGLNFKHHLTSTGLLDEGYSGSIHVKLYNNSNKWKYVKKGDKISQLVIVPCSYPELEVVDELKETDRGADGFGSSGR